MSLQRRGEEASQVSNSDLYSLLVEVDRSGTWLERKKSSTWLERKKSSTWFERKK